MSTVVALLGDHPEALPVLEQLFGNILNIDAEALNEGL